MESQTQPIDHVFFVVHGTYKLLNTGMGNQFEGMGKFEQNGITILSFETVSQLRQTCNQVINEEFDKKLNIEWIPIEWHSLLHQMKTVDERIKKITLPTCSILRNLQNDTLADVLYYFTSFHGQVIVDLVTKTMNEVVYFSVMIGIRKIHDQESIIHWKDCHFWAFFRSYHLL
jgi:hypothetical protein